MAYTNFETKEISCKILYSGPAGSGKTENLRSIYAATDDSFQQNAHQFIHSAKPTEYFDFLPLSLGDFGGFHLKLHLYTLPNPMLYPSLTQIVMRGIDGFVFVADSRFDSMESNFESLEAFKGLLVSEGCEAERMPGVFQYNMQDCEHTINSKVLAKELNWGNFPSFAAVAHRSIGTLECFQSVGQQTIAHISAI